MLSPLAGRYLRGLQLSLYQQLQPDIFLAEDNIKDQIRDLLNGSKAGALPQGYRLALELSLAQALC